ncbi:hypothetical protein D2917_28215 [Cupriavidus oxalaticus]|uniref:Uncharacterized protein n=1 Tax=Cupriavidus oxalaticus TaxID=96344 RepID=A0A5P3VNJ2_9BURK|nr:hypothetical protein D2917_28215 [Cupriavidus oxalaticus]
MLPVCSPLPPAGEGPGVRAGARQARRRVTSWTLPPSPPPLSHCAGEGSDCLRQWPLQAIPYIARLEQRTPACAPALGIAVCGLP